MFTGIIEEIGIVKEISFGTKSCRITISAKKVLDETRIGDSICTNGVCLTIVEISISRGFFVADVMAETMNRSNFKNLSVGERVNLERAMKASDRFGGHIVSGHIDGEGTIISISKDDIATLVYIKASTEIISHIVEKGSITIDGVSLTVVNVDDNTGSFYVSIIPHTGSETILLTKKVGDKVNLENDVIAKYVGRLMSFESNKSDNKKSDISVNFLAENGFL